MFQLMLYAQSYETLSKNIIRELNYIYQDKTWKGGSTFKEGRTFKYTFKSVSSYEIEIMRNINGISDDVFILDLKESFSIELEPDIKCDPALTISHELDIIYLYVKDRCGHFGGFNLYKRAEDASVLLRQYLYQARELRK